MKREPEEIFPGDNDLVLSDGLDEKGFLRPHGAEFEIFAKVDDDYVYLATGTRAEAIKLLKNAASKREAAR